ncbi:MAG: SDR family oxidoreductase [Gammaproteobacteria bacterium]|nr:SDR family oxidoreductase [Gammaproteobacteria bacterium]
MSIPSSAIVNTSSMTGLVGTQMMGVYSAAKAGVIALTKCAALDYAKQGLRVNAVCPGVIDTPFLGTGEDIVAKITPTIPMSRLGTSEEIANAVLWLSSDQSSYMTGHAMVIDGGFTIP